MFLPHQPTFLFSLQNLLQVSPGCFTALWPSSFWIKKISAPCCHGSSCHSLLSKQFLMRNRINSVYRSFKIIISSKFSWNIQPFFFPQLIGFSLSLNFNGSFSFFNFLFLFILLYEIITLLLETWGCFHYGWWNLGYSAITNSVLVFIMLGCYKWNLSITATSKNR